jgi:hypothetical protein
MRDKCHVLNQRARGGDSIADSACSVLLLWRHLRLTERAPLKEGAPFRETFGIRSPWPVTSCNKSKLL